MSRPHVFVSFSSKDRAQVRRLFARLGAQPLELWNYADEGQEIPGGDVLTRHLKEKIDRSDYFLPFISANSLSSSYTQLEVRYALKCQAENRLRIVPLVMPSCLPAKNWVDPYCLLVKFRYRLIDFQSAASLEEIVIALCADMSIQYLPLPTTDPRLPLMDRFVAEIEDICPRREERDIAVYQRLMLVMSEFEEAFAEGDFPRALARIAYFVLTCEYEFPKEQVYYPYVVKAICEIACGRLINATETLNDLLMHPRLDENVFGTLGYIHQQQGRYREALGYYREAVKLDATDPAAKAGEVTNAILCGEPLDVATAFQEIDNATLLVPEDRIKIRALKAFALWKSGALEAAEQEFAELTNEGQLHLSILLNFAHVLIDQDKHHQARDLLEKFQKDYYDERVLHLLASINFQIGDLNQAVRQFEVLVQKYPRSRQYWIDAAQAFWRAGKHDKARDVAKALLDSELFPLPGTPEDFFCNGFANWLLGRYDRADYDFERSTMPEKNHYRHLLSDSSKSS